MPNPVDLKICMPISLVGCDYKPFVKDPRECLRSVIFPHIISPAKGAFMKDRQIVSLYLMSLLTKGNILPRRLSTLR